MLGEATGPPNPVLLDAYASKQCARGAHADFANNRLAVSAPHRPVVYRYSTDRRFGIKPEEAHDGMEAPQPHAEGRP